LLEQLVIIYQHNEFSRVNCGRSVTEFPIAGEIHNMLDGDP